MVLVLQSFMGVKMGVVPCVWSSRTYMPRPNTLAPPRSQGSYGQTGGRTDGHG